LLGHAEVEDREGDDAALTGTRSVRPRSTATASAWCLT